MKAIIKKVVDKITGRNKKFLPVVDEQGKFETVEKPKFFPVTEREHLLEMRQRGYYGNGQCKGRDF